MSQKFIIDKDPGNFCISYIVASPSISPSSGRLSFYNNDVQSSTQVSISKTNFSNKNIAPYLTGSNKGNLTISSKDFPTSYVIFPYIEVTEGTDHINFLFPTVSPVASAFSSPIPFARGETVCISLDYNDGTGGGDVDIQGGTDISVTGEGSTSDPYIVSYTGTSGTGGTAGTSGTSGTSGTFMEG